MKRFAPIAFAFALIACGDDAPASHDTLIDTADNADATMSDTSLDSMQDTADTAPDVEPDIEPEIVEPIACDPGSACNALLDLDGQCPGACFVIPEGPQCLGEVHNGLCYRYSPYDQITNEADLGDFYVTPLEWPTETTVGETSAFEVRLSNKTGNTLNIPFGKKDPGNFSFADATWDGLTTITIPPLESVTLSASITALKATVFAGTGIIITFQFGEAENASVWEAYTKIHYPPNEGIACGGERFPETYCADPINCYASSSFYMTSKCCDDVFYPSAQCCSDDDCVSGGGCIDGKCVIDTPALNSANTVPLGNQRILFVIVEEDAKFSFDPCADRYDAMHDGLQLDLVEGWFDEVAERRFGHSTLDLRWEVRTGMKPEDVLHPEDSPDGNTYLTRIDEYMQAQGCGGVLDTYDKLIVASPTMDLGGYGGIYGNEGHVVTRNAELPYLLTHELTHSLGAFDLYLDMGGTYQYWSSLMADNVIGDPYPGDDVAWGEMGYADIDRNGVIDLAEHAAFPETLEVADLSAVLTTKNTLEISWHFVGREDGLAKKVIVTQYELTVPNTPTRIWFGANTLRTQVYGPPEVDLDALGAAGHVDAHIKAELRYTDRDWQRRVLTFDETRTIPITTQE